ncbi:hypothetical protein V1283_007341 [Bradyrhizobium sp. AZCC 2262]
MALRLISRSPRRAGLVVTVASRISRSIQLDRCATARLDASIGASGPHDFAVRIRAVRQRHIRVHRIPSRACDDRETPLVPGRDEIDILLIWPHRQVNFGKSEIDLRDRGHRVRLRSSKNGAEHDLFGKPLSHFSGSCCSRAAPVTSEAASPNAPMRDHYRHHYRPKRREIVSASASNGSTPIYRNFALVSGSERIALMMEVSAAISVGDVSFGAPTAYQSPFE